jgi:hypothetical protein
MRFSVLMVGLFLIAAANSARAGLSLSDVQFWTGSGTNEAAMVIDWRAPEVRNRTTVPNPVEDLTLAWGYRFNGTASGQDMFNAILAADHRLYAVYNRYGGVAGLGYDANGTGVIGVTDGTHTDPGSKFTNGILYDPRLNIDAAHAIDPTNMYWGGWDGPNWELWTEQGENGGFATSPDRGPNTYWTPDLSDPYFGTGSHGQWDLAGWGINYVTLSNGSWMGWTVAAGGYNYSDPNDPGTVAYEFDKQAPSNDVVAAAPLPSAVWMALPLLGLLASTQVLRRWVAERA